MPCCNGLLRFKKRDLDMLSKWPIESFCTNLLDLPTPFILHPPLQTILKVFNIPTLKTIYTKYEYNLLKEMCALKSITIIPGCSCCKFKMLKSYCKYN